METVNQSEYTVVRRTAAVPVQRTRISEPEPQTEPKVPLSDKIKKAGTRLSGEGKLLLVQTIAGGVLLAAVTAGLALGGPAFRTLYQMWTEKYAIHLPSLVEPIEPEDERVPESDPHAAMARL